MSIHDPVIVRLEVEQMKYSILHAFTQHELVQSGALNAALDAAVKNFDFTAEVAQILRGHLHQEVERAQAIVDAVWASDEVRARIRQIVSEQIALIVKEP